MPLPVIRLQRTNIHNATLTRDPVCATATLYCFLRPVPSVAEQQLAMEEFVRTLTEERVLEYKPNTRVVIALEKAIIHGILRRPPLVSPGRCRRSDAWKEALSPSPIEEEAEVEERGGAVDPVVGDGSNHHYVAQSALREFQDPYEEYVERFGLPQEIPPPGAAGADRCLHISRPSSQRSPSAVLETSEDALEHSGSTAAPEGTADGEVNVTLSDTNDDTIRASDYSTSSIMMPLLQCSDPMATRHPLLDLIAQQVCQDLPWVEEAWDEAGVQAIASGLETSKRHLAFAKQRVGEAAEACARDASIWDPSHTYYKNAIAFVGEMENRIQVAARLHALDYSERQTVCTAHCALLTEVMTMRLLLRDVSRAVEEHATQLAETAVHDRPGLALDVQQADALLVRELRDALNGAPKK